MKIAFYAPFKPLDHEIPSGDLIIATGLVSFLRKQGHIIDIQSRLRSRWIYLKPGIWLHLAGEFIRCFRRLKKEKPDIWLTYHTYYKAPDLLGPWICRLLGIPYVIFQGIYSTKPRRHVKSFLGFYLNRAALNRADHVFTNKRSDYINLKRIIDSERLSYIKPGINLEFFSKTASERPRLLKIPELQGKPLILTAAMFRDDVKTKGLVWLIRCCAELVNKNISFHLVIAGSGTMENRLKQVAEKYLPGRHTFTGKISQHQMQVFYRSGDIFAFPGIRESLGMVFLEAQACGLPVVAFNNGGIPEVVGDGKTGLLVPMYDCNCFCKQLVRLLTDKKLCKQMGKKAVQYVEKYHDLKENYKQVEQILILKAAG